ncbi:MAG: hypothetical protein ACKOW5_06560, partial [Actinomycetales bacterium]
MERKDAVAAVIAGTGILAAATIAGLAVVKLATPETTGIADAVSVVQSTPPVQPVELPELTAVPSLVPQLPQVDEGSGPGRNNSG